MPPNNDLEKRLWAAADQLRANSSLTAQEYSRPVLGLIFLKYADHRFTVLQTELSQKGGKGRRTIGKLDYQARGVMYLPDKGKAINRAMDSIEAENEDLKGVLPREYNRFDNTLLFELLKLVPAKWRCLVPPPAGNAIRYTDES